MGETLGTMITLTTYGTWLRGDMRGWVDDGRTLPADPELESADRQRMKEEPFLFSASQLGPVGDWIGASLVERKGVAIYAMTVESWHCHIVIGPTEHSVADIVKCAKDAVRWGLRVKRPIWTEGYDKRFCFDQVALRARIAYVEKHNLRSGLLAKPWAFIT